MNNNSICQKIISVNDLPIETYSMQSNMKRPYFLNLKCLTAALLFFAMLLQAFPSYAASCSGSALVDVSFPSGARWELCWELRNEEGIVLTEVGYETPTNIFRNVLKEAALAGVNVAFDDGSPSQRHVTDVANGGGLGANVQTLTALDCNSGTLHNSLGNNVLCVRVVPRNYTYKSYSNVKQGDALILESRAVIGASSYIVRWRLWDDGTIQPQVGMAGQIPVVGSDATYGWALDASNRIGVGFNTSYFWRLDFDLAADGSNEVIEQFEVTPSANRLTKSLSVSTINTEATRTLSPDVKRSWRIRDEAGVTNSDGRPISYHIEPLHAAHQYLGASTEAWAVGDIHFTRYNSCERFVVDNPTAGGCGADITQFVNGETMLSEDLVIWYKLNYHHLPRNEDEPAIQIHWDSFFILPRDWTATNPLAMNLRNNKNAVEQS